MFPLIGIIGAFGEAHLPVQPSQQDETPIIVSGERWSRTQAETASSVSVTTNDDLDRQPDTDRLDQIIEYTPNIVTGSGTLGPAIRGLDTTGVLNNLPAFLGGNRPRTTVTVDGRAISYNEFVFGTQSLWDVQQIEIFRSPQTTTQGRNSIAGAIFVETRQPEFEWDGTLRTIGGNYRTRHGSVALTGPIVPSQLAFRVSADHRRSLTSSELTSRAVGIDPNRDAYDQLRVKLLAVPDALPDLRVETAYWITSSHAPQVEGMREPFEERKDPRANYGIFRSHSESGTMRADWQLANMTAVHATFSAGGATVQRFAAPGIGEALNEVHDRFLEVSIKHALQGGKAVGGISASRNRLSQSIDLSNALFGLGHFKDRQDSLGIFGDLEGPLAPQLMLSVGARYQTDRQIRQGTLSNSTTTSRLDFDQAFSFLLPKFSLRYDSSRELSLGLLVQKAANPGGVTLTPAGKLDTFDAESLWDFEIFGRGNFADGNTSYSLNLFKYVIREAQRSVNFSVPTSGGLVTFSEIGNAPRAWSKGAEFALLWQATARLKFRGAIGLLDTRLTRTPETQDPLLDKQFQRSPHLTATAGLNWFPLNELSVDANWRHRSGYFSDDRNLPGTRIDPASVLDLRASWKLRRVRIFGYLRNAFDSFHLTYKSGTIDPLANAIDPREFGLGIEVRL